jgi:hypothetical protein
VESILIGNGIRVNGRDYEIIGVEGGDVHSDESDVTKFDVFSTTPYTYLQISRNSVTGNRIVGSYNAEGIFDMNSGMVRGENSENIEQGSVLDIKPTEPFLEDVPSNREHYTVTLIQTDYSDYEESS